MMSTMSDITAAIKTVKWALVMACITPGCTTLGMAPPTQEAEQVATASTDVACALGLAQSAATAVSAGLEGVPAEWLAEQLCRDPEIVAAFMRARKARSVDPGRAAVLAARARGLCK